MQLRLIVLLTVLVCALQNLASTEAVFAEKRSAPTLAVIGAAASFDDRRWEDARIGVGIREVLSETLYDTDRFSPLAEEEDARRRIDDFTRAVWTLEGDEDAASRFEAQADSIDADKIAWGIVDSFSVPQAGLQRRSKQTAVVRVRVYIMNSRTGRVIDEVGEGKSRRTATSSLFSFREKTKGGTVNLDKTAVGHATHEAIKAAVKTLKKKGWLD